MANFDHDLIKDVDDSKDTWCVVARVLRKWIMAKKTPPFDIFKVGMILVDEQGYRVEAFMSQKAQLQRYMDEITEGEVYQFENFVAVPNNDAFKLCHHTWKIRFHSMTFFQKHDLAVPLNAFNFVPIKDIADYNATNYELIDVIGFLQAFGNLVDHKKDSQTIKTLNFTIADHNQIPINVALFGDVAINAFEARTDDLEVPTVVVIRFARISTTKGYGHITNAFHATRVLFNPDLPEVRELIARLGETPGASQNFSQVSSTVMLDATSNSLLTFPTRIPLSEISKLTKESQIVTKVTIQKVESEYGWTYDGCPCDKKPVHVDDKLMKCTSCNQEVLKTEPKFKVHYKVFDSTGQCSMLFFNRHASALLECSASELKKKVGSSRSFPKELDRPVGKEIVVMVKVKENNIKYPASSMGVSQFSVKKDILDQFTYSNVSADANANVKNSPIESSSSYSSPKMLGTHNIADDDDDLTISQIITPVETLSKKKRNGKNESEQLDDIGLSEGSPPSFSSTKPAKKIKKEK
ncbi:replication protein A 70 kDa DNA-binding subunit D-like [Neltuma alba]|uniref:replication protein A 70 kDa DNA-binding subunit D-like n=1 Tax=Neltuma alba TaxID=207710 RepID=UPI0010A3B5C8|nr:replication protein A 70 kDa DNA-binding subunit D-like [Prosopis alba]